MIIPKEAIAAKYLIKTHYIFKVLAFHPETQSVDIVQDVLEFVSNPESDNVVINEFGIPVPVSAKMPEVIYNVPVKQERWGQFEIQCCPKEGDTGYIEVFTNDINSWIKQGGINIPTTDNHFDITSCVFVPFIPNEVNCSKDYPADNTRLVIKSTNAKIEIVDGEDEVSITTTAKNININAEEGIQVAGNINVEGDISVTGAVSVDGTITATQNIKSSTDVVVETAPGTGVSLLKHTHNCTAPGTPSGAPIPMPITSGV